MQFLEAYYQNQNKLINFQVGDAPGDNWKGLLAALHLQHINAVHSSKTLTTSFRIPWVQNLNVISTLNSLCYDVNVMSIKTYLELHFLRQAAVYELTAVTFCSARMPIVDNWAFLWINNIRTSWRIRILGKIYMFQSSSNQKHVLHIFNNSWSMWIRTASGESLLFSLGLTANTFTVNISMCLVLSRLSFSPIR